MHNRRQKALHKAVKAMESKTSIYQNKLIHLEDSMFMYGVSSTETLEKVTKQYRACTIGRPYLKKIFAGQLILAYQWYINSCSNRGVQHYAINSLLYLRMIKDKYVQM